MGQRTYEHRCLLLGIIHIKAYKALYRIHILKVGHRKNIYKNQLNHHFRKKCVLKFQIYTGIISPLRSIRNPLSAVTTPDSASLKSGASKLML
ncbi:MAG: hypothetical protein C5S38_06760 [Candidatus Methanophagaceae archaeon]|nr:MAG: hypothetical protein C5S38_06760 [Methanophagales archaeon]